MITGALAVLALQQALVVSPTGPYRQVGDALRAAPDGAIITIRAGEYREPTLRVERPVTIIGEPGAVLDGEGVRELMVVTANGVTVRGLTFRHTGSSYREDRAALRVVEVRDCRIEGNRFEGTFFGIYLQGAVGCQVHRNVVQGSVASEGTTGNGIHAWSASHLTLRGNTISGHRDGIYLEFSRHAVVEDNRSTHNRRYGLHFMYSDSSAYVRNVFRANGTGVAVMFSSVVHMTDNEFSGNRGPSAYGLLLKEIGRSRLSHNRFLDNTTALVADGANGLEVDGNRFLRNGRAVRLLASTVDGEFVGNSFEANSFDVVVNSRGVTTKFRGNWWDGYRGWDLDGDGVGDVAHHPVRLFSLLVERSEPVMLLQRSLFVRLVDAAERAVPALTPRTVRDDAPLMRPMQGVGE
jgi:nitrous oxidase accessory protein